MDYFVSGEHLDYLWRLLLALSAGAVIGLNRFLRQKAAGMRTHALVSLGSAMAVLLFPDSDSTSRVAQGVLTGVGFIGAGVIMRNGVEQVQGLTTAASVWTCAILGIVCGAGEPIVVAMGVVLILFVLIIGRPIERRVARLLKEELGPHDKSG
jgi:putative Mg2+ transporter-C (MgtC) family protein